MQMKKSKIIICISSVVVSALALAVAIPFAILGIRTGNLKADYSYLKTDENYSTKVSVEGIELKEQEISCGYATIEMLSNYYGNKVDEKELETRNNGAITTASSDGFLKEVNKTIPNKQFIKRSYLRNDTLLKEIHRSLKNNDPVALEWAALYQEEWTLHFSLISALDIQNDNIQIYNPYGYIEDISINEFIDRASFKAYKNMPMFLSFGFAFGAFEKNTIFYAK